MAAWASVYGAQSYVGDYNRYPGMEMGCLTHVDVDSDYANTQGQYQKIYTTTGSTSTPSSTFNSSPYASYSENAYISIGYEGSGNWLSTDGLTQKRFYET